MLKPAGRPINVLVADDHIGVAASLTSTLAQWFVAEPAVNSLEQLSGALSRQWAAGKRDLTTVVVLDLAFGDSSALRALPSLKQRYPDVHFLMYSAHFSEVLVDNALGAGAAGYVDKCCGLTELRSAIEAVVEGEVPVYGAVGGRSLGPKMQPQQDLTPALRRVLRLLKAGYSHARIATNLGISRSAVEGNVARLRRAFGLPPRARVDWSRLADE